MPPIPVRGAGTIGVISDISPQDTPISAWTSARNIRFAEGSVSRYSVFKTARVGYTYAKTPVGVFSGSSALDTVLVTVFSDGSMEQVTSSGVTSVTPAGVTSASPEQISSTTLGGVTYVNVPSVGPFFRVNPVDGSFTALPGWASEDRCHSLRSYKDFLVALNVSKGETLYPGMVKWSNAAQSGAVPSDWSVVDEASLAGETVLNDIRGKLIDGAVLGDSFILYGEHQTFRMDYIGTPFIFKIVKVFEDQGTIARNCVVEVEGRHYVFGKTDIYVHDGLGKQSLVVGKVSKTIFREIDYSKVDRCFVYHDRVNSELGFCYPSTDSLCKWTTGAQAGCNKAAVYNYLFQTWTFVDLPNLSGAAHVALNTSTDWAGLTTWSNASQTWGSFGNSKPSSLLVTSVGNGSKPAQPYFLDNALSGFLANQADPDLFWSGEAEMLHRDLDEIGADLYGRKLVTRVVPQYRVRSEDDSIVFKIGQSKNASGAVLWGPDKVFSGYTSDKYDTRVNGRYLSLGITIPTGKYAEFSGFDLNMKITSGR